MVDSLYAKVGSIPLSFSMCVDVSVVDGEDHITLIFVDLS